MSDPRHTRPLRADAARNRARVIDAARVLFARRGVDVPLDEIAERAGVGAGTVHRHFPTKQALLVAIVVERLEKRIQRGEKLAEAGAPDGLFELLEGLLDDGQESLAVKDALSRSGFDLRASAPRTARRLDETVRLLLTAARTHGTVAEGVDLDDVKTLLAGALAAQAHVSTRPGRIIRARELALAGLRPLPDRARAAHHG